MFWNTRELKITTPPLEGQIINFRGTLIYFQGQLFLDGARNLKIWDTYFFSRGSYFFSGAVIFCQMHLFFDHLWTVFTFKNRDFFSRLRRELVAVIF